MTTGTKPPTPPERSRRSRTRTYLPLAVAVWLVLEIWLLTVIAGAAGGGTVFLLLLAGLVGGVVVIRRTGRRAFQRLSRTLQAQQRGEPAPEEQGGSGLLIVAGLLLILPGAISDVLGLLLLLPPVRGAVGRLVERRVRAAVPGWSDPFQRARMHRPDGKVVPGEVVRDDHERRPGDSGPDDPGPRPPLNP
jgi:UPF0716 protein FxsA